MISIHRRSVNVKTSEVLEKLKINLEIHRAEYAAAVVAYRQRLNEDLKLAAELVPTLTDYAALHFEFECTPPQSHIRDFEEVIKMLEASADAVINLDYESFQAYMFNSWEWQARFSASNSTYGLAGYSLKYTE